MADLHLDTDKTEREETSMAAVIDSHPSPAAVCEPLQASPGHRSSAVLLSSSAAQTSRPSSPAAP